MNTKILAPFAFAFVAILAGCSGSSIEGNERASSQLAKGGEKGEPGKGEPTKDDGSDPGKDVPSDEKGDPGKDPGKEPSDVPEKDPSSDPGKDPGKEPSEPSSCFAEAYKASCQSDDAWKSAAEKICGSKGLSVGGLSTAGDCKEGSSVAKIECCK